MPKITVINPIEKTELKTDERKYRVCAYCRVSSDSREQLQSLSAQMEHYTAMIKKNPQWQFCGVYADEGISGTSRGKRDEFQRLIKDCEAGKIDTVITKSISRWARNTADSIEVIRKLKSLGIGIYFEKENVNTLSDESELVLTILSSMAQEESISISRNNRWSCQKRFQSGEWVPSYLPYGYDLDAEGNIIIKEPEAEVVRKIFNDYLNGKGAHTIAKELTDDGISTKRGNSCWSEGTVRDILQNEKYAGDLLMQKTFTTDTIPFIRKRNKGQKQKYLIEDNHQPIIERDQAEKASGIKEYRKKQLKNTGPKYISKYPFSGRILCGECGQAFIRRIIFKNMPYQYIQWSCGRHIRDITQCSMKAVKEEEVKQAYIQLFNKLKCNTNKILTPLLEELKKISAEDYAGEEVTECNNRIYELNEQSQVLNRLRSKGYIDSALFIQKSNDIEIELEELKSKRNKMLDNTNVSLEIEQTKQLISTIKAHEGLIDEFNQKLFEKTIKTITVKSQTQLAFTLINELELTEYL